jgi:uncharacterized protein YukE
MSIEVDLQAIRALARGFQAVADALGESASAFRAAAQVRAAAFGALPGGQRARADYASRLETAVSSLRDLQAILERFGSNLESTAANWEQADEGGAPGGPVR